MFLHLRSVLLQGALERGLWGMRIPKEPVQSYPRMTGASLISRLSLPLLAIAYSDMV